MIKKNRKKSILDTSVQLEKIKEPLLARRLESMADLYSLYFVQYEYKVGFIRHMIDFYKLVEITKDPAKALVKVSNLFETRNLKYGFILQALMERLSKKISRGSTLKDYLRMVEASINHALQVFDISLKGLVGEFSNDDVVRCSINSRDDYPGFIELVNRRRATIPLESFWVRNGKSLQNLISDGTIYERINNPHKRDFTPLRKVLIEIEKDKGRCVIINNNKKLGDAVISVDCPQTYTLLSKDYVFTILCRLLLKELKLLSKELTFSDPPSMKKLTP